jgi:hypothetical protein
VSKPKKILFELIKPEDVYLSGQPYELLSEIRAEHHFDTAEANIALAWKKGTKPDADGRLCLGRCVKASDLQRELVDYDFVIVLNKEVWEDPEFSREKRLALLDHEMCHAARAVDDEGVKKIDSKGRPVYRVRGHDIEEFHEIVDRHGIWKGDLEKFAKVLEARRKSPLFAAADDVPPPLLAAIDNLASSVRTGEAGSITISTPGMDSIVIDKEAADNIHRRAKRKPN